MDDIPNAGNSFTFILYADDTTLFSTIEYSIPSSASNYHQTINLNLSKVTDWLIANRLSLNVKKNKYMLFHPYQKDITQVTPRLMLNNDEIERVDSFNFLGVTIDKHLNWKQHIEIIANKLSKYCGILSKLKNYLPTYTRVTLYTAGHCTQPCPIVHTAVPPLFTQPCPGRTMSTAVCIYVARLCASCPAV